MDKSKLTRGGAGPVGLPTDTVDVTIDGVVETLLVRGLNRGELLHLGKLSDSKGQAAAERYMLSCALLDPADMTEDDVADWQASAPGMECHSVVMKINALSGAEKDAQKSDVARVRDEPGPGV